MNTNRLVVAAAALCSAALLSACGLTGNDPAPVQQPVQVPAQDTAAAPAPTTPAAAAPTAVIPNLNPTGGYWPAKVVSYQNPQLGEVVVDGDGYTLYRFDDDNAKPSKSACYDDCAKKWPPVLTKDTIQFVGINGSYLGGFARPDGTTQVTISGWPVYRFAGDLKPGDTNGEGIGNTWFAVNPVGQKAGKS
ncbi:hypothetical protein [Winogradskya humida]|uniref:Lipoprotein with Yx(FWY)xxD motif n=1 Tax=Winogradskya humida TaxID=113566 RepID=A0ABQ3ZP16_9ACTN|nr:hypothetical protein [Actinoplanes humidus]GIE20325.1 hypothetical protein Ahu01nite_034270 [Actinoplanes humidus]